MVLLSWLPCCDGLYPATVSQNKSFLLYVALVRISLSLKGKQYVPPNMTFNTVYSVSVPLTVPEKRKQCFKIIQLNKDTLLLRGGNRKE